MTRSFHLLLGARRHRPPLQRAAKHASSKQARFRKLAASRRGISRLLSREIRDTRIFAAASRFKSLLFQGRYRFQRLAQALP